MTTKTENKIESIRHSLSHLLAMAVLEKFPKAELGIGPTIENGFYYDFGNIKISDADLPELEKQISGFIAQNLDFEKEVVTFTEAKKLFAKQPYKLELIKELNKDKQNISIYSTCPSEIQNSKLKIKNCFTDLCAGPHVKSTKEINPDAFKLTKIAGAYWRGDEKNPMLTRIYGVAFETKKELEDYLEMQEEAEKRDHRKLGKDLKIFTFSEMVGPGLPLWLPNGTVIINELEKLARKMEDEREYLQVKTPHIAKEIMYKTSGHLPYYADTMFPPMVLEEDGQKTKYYLKAMNCPHHHQIFLSEQRSYKNLPLRLAEYGTCYRYEKSGELFGLMRVRSMQMNDAHIYCAEEQFAEEFLAVVKLYLEYFKIFGIEKYVMRLSTHSKEGLGKKYIDNEKLWEKTEAMVRDIMVKENIPFKEVSNEAAFYGPKIDVEVWSAIGREFTLATNQVDFAVPERFGLTYIDKDGKEKTPICIHRAPLGTHERTIGFLIEHFAGAFPLWLSPVQAVILPISEKQNSYAQKIADELKKENIRVGIPDPNETLGKRIREAEMQKTPYILVVGDKEIAAESVSVRQRGKPSSAPADAKVLAGKKTMAGKGDLNVMKLNELILKLKKEISEKSLS